MVLLGQMPRLQFQIGRTIHCFNANGVGEKNGWNLSEKTIGIVGVEM